MSNHNVSRTSIVLVSILFGVALFLGNALVNSPTRPAFSQSTSPTPVTVTNTSASPVLINPVAPLKVLVQTTDTSTVKMTAVAQPRTQKLFQNLNTCALTKYGQLGYRVAAAGPVVYLTPSTASCTLGLSWAVLEYP